MPMREIAYWPDGSWCDSNHVDKKMREAGLSDDFALVEVDESIDDEEVDETVAVYNDGHQYSRKSSAWTIK